MMLRYFKVTFYKCIMYAPIVFGIIGILFIWFIQVPYRSSLYYCNANAFCYDCDTSLGTDSKFCPVCSKEIEMIAAIKTFAHCDYCDSNVLYKNEIPEFCKNCGNKITEGTNKLLKELGYKDIKEFRNALYLENLKRLFSNKIFATVLVIIVTKLSFSFVVQLMTYLARRKILKEGKNRF